MICHQLSRHSVSAILKVAALSWMLYVTAESKPPFCHPDGQTCRPQPCAWTMQSGTMYCSCPSSQQGILCQALGYIPGYFKKYHANCTVIDKKVQCFCDRGYEWGSDGICQDINECTKDLCPQTAKCTNLNGTFSCECGRGYSQSRLQNKFTCQDVNECTERTFACPSNSHCVNSIGSYQCKCSPGFTRGSGTAMCQECRKHRYGENCANECSDKCVLRTCDKVDGRCIGGCLPGYQGDRCQLDLDECARTPPPCPQNSVCANTPGSYRCVCARGYRQEAKKDVCRDVDECKERPNACSQFAVCSNIPGSYRCRCEPGYVMVTRSGRSGCVACREGSYGDRCKSRCSRRCRAGLCHARDGSCKNGCEAGFHGRYCDQSPLALTSVEMNTMSSRITTSHLNVTTRSPTQRSLTIYWIIAGVGGGTLLLLIMVFIVVCLVCRTNKSKNAERNSDTTAQGTDYFRKLRAGSKHYAVNEDLPSTPFSDFESFDDTSYGADEMAVFATIGKPNKLCTAPSPNRRSKAYVNVNIVDEVPQLTVHLPSGDEYSAPVAIGARTSASIERNIYDTTQ